ncbi:hypothetical protein [Actinomadura sp. GTD37]|uniref:hypothetical protein n=1 Tax=Actinomadura sp. GTD37 TaxID=1778030 RepID=UPI0035BEFFE9
MTFALRDDACPRSCGRAARSKAGHFEDARLLAEIENGRFQVTSAEAPAAEVALTTDVGPFRAVIFGGRPMVDAARKAPSNRTATK